MATKAVLLLPDSYDSTLPHIVDAQTFSGFFHQVLTSITVIGRENNLKVIYDQQNIDDFFSFCAQWGAAYLASPRTSLNTILQKRGLRVQTLSNKDPQCHYIFWELAKYPNVVYAPDFIAAIAEYKYANPGDDILIMNFNSDWTPDSAMIYVFKDANNLTNLPDRFAQLISIADIDELRIWLSTSHVQTFSLLNRSKFGRTGFVQQGKPVYVELETGRFWYLDNFHKNEYEVFNADRVHIGVATLEGELDQNKAVVGRTMN